jgi:dihydrolipoamide dehydrogenase
VCAIRLAQLGVPVVLVEKEARLGGVCLNWGCIPSKAYISAAKLWAEIGHVDAIGISVGKPSLDLKKMCDWKNSIVARLTGGIAELMKRHKVQVIHGRGQFTSDKSLEVTLQAGGKEVIEAENFVIATVSRSNENPAFPEDEKRLFSST